MADERPPVDPPPARRHAPADQATVRRSNLGSGPAPPARHRLPLAGAHRPGDRAEQGHRLQPRRRAGRPRGWSGGRRRPRRLRRAARADRAPRTARRSAGSASSSTSTTPPPSSWTCAARCCSSTGSPSTSRRWARAHPGRGGRAGARGRRRGRGAGRRPGRGHRRRPRAGRSVDGVVTSRPTSAGTTSPCSTGLRGRAPTSAARSGSRTTPTSPRSRSGPWAPEARTPDLVYLTGEVGVGGGVIVAGQLLRGAERAVRRGRAHALGEPDRLCGCGRRGCWETVVGLGALLRDAADEDDPVRDPGRDLETRLAEIAARAEAGDGRTLAALGRWARCSAPAPPCSSTCSTPGDGPGRLLRRPRPVPPGADDHRAARPGVRSRPGRGARRAVHPRLHRRGAGRRARRPRVGVRRPDRRRRPHPSGASGRRSPSATAPTRTENPR